MSLFSLGNVDSPATPDYSGLLDRQNQYNQNLAQQQAWMNNPNQVTPYGSRTMTRDPSTGQYTVNTSFSPTIQSQFDSQNQFNVAANNAANSLLSRANQGLNYGSAPSMPQFNMSGVPKMQAYDTSNAGPKAVYDVSNLTSMPNASESDLNAMRDSVYGQQTQYLDPQFQQGQSDLDAKLANQGIMPGSEAYNREINNFGLQKQKAYSDARNSAIQAGGSEQSRLFGLGLQSRQQGVNEAMNQFNTGLQNRQQGINESLNQFNTGLQGHQQGMNDALAQFNTGLQSRQQGVSETNNMYNAPINALASLRGGQQIQMPQFQGITGTSIPGVDYMQAAQNTYNANLDNTNAENASNQNVMNGLFGLGNAALQNPDAVKSGYNWLTGLFEKRRMG